VDPDGLFVYGSLQFPEVLKALLKRLPNREPATATGWRVTTLPGRVYPGLVADDRTVTGFLLTDVTADEWRVVDAFEDDVYELRRLSLATGKHGWAYVCRQDAEVSQQDWDPNHFAVKHLKRYVDSCSRWRDWHDSNQQSQAG
jgi:gamma-glutamylcyclotransferase (GGCT)/AIG2-like uncharacterized protein YtfP